MRTFDGGGGMGCLDVERECSSDSGNEVNEWVCSGTKVTLGRRRGSSDFGFDGFAFFEFPVPYYFCC